MERVSVQLSNTFLVIKMYTNYVMLPTVCHRLDSCILGSCLHCCNGQRCIIFCPCLTHKLSSKLSELHKHIFLAFRIGSLTFNDWAISLVLNIHFKERVSTEREILPILPCLRTPEDNFNSHNLEEGVLLVSTK